MVKEELKKEEVRNIFNFAEDTTYQKREKDLMAIFNLTRSKLYNLSDCHLLVNKLRKEDGLPEITIDEFTTRFVKQDPPVEQVVKKK